MRPLSLGVTMAPALFLAATISSQTPPQQPKPAPPPMEAKIVAPSADAITWRKLTLDKTFQSEGVAVADVNKDGKPDVMAGSFWYEAPNWTPRELAPVQKFDGEKGYSNFFLGWAADVNKDGWADQIVVGFPGEKCVWRENPKNKPGHWQERIIWRSACNESPAYADLLGNKNPVLVFPYDEKFMGWYEPTINPNAEFTSHVTGLDKQPGTQKFSHGLGVGDVNGDKRNDILTNEGWYEAPDDPRSGPWKFIPAKLGDACAQMYTLDVNLDGLPDVVNSSAHNIGVWWQEQKKGASGPEFIQHVIDNTFSQSHSMVMADIDKDGSPDFVTGKRFWAHGPTGDVNPADPAVIYWYEVRRDKNQPKWIRHEVDNDSGVGTQFTVTDVNKDGLPDIVTSNKKGVYVFLQQRKKPK
jgi:hypothetical protein